MFTRYLVHDCFWAQIEWLSSADSDMQPRRGGLPPRPAVQLSVPQLSQNAASYASQQYNAMTMSNQSALTAQAVTAALSNPYAQTYSSRYHSSHYAQGFDNAAVTA